MKLFKFNKIRQKTSIDIYVFIFFICVFTLIYLTTANFQIEKVLYFINGQVYEFDDSFNWFRYSFFFFLFALYLMVGSNVILAAVGRNTREISFKNIFKKGFELAKFVFLFTITLSTEALAIGGVYLASSGRLLNEEFYLFEYRIFGAMPFLWLHSLDNGLKPILDFLASVILYSFTSVSLVISLTIAYLILKNKKELVIKYSISFFLGSLLAIPIWYSFPINSPNNYILNKEVKIESFEPNEVFKTFTADVRERQRENPPITTFPSMHTYWALISVYFLSRANKKWLIIGLPWFSLLYLGTFYFAQHYAIDGLLSIIMAIPIIYFVEKLYPFLSQRLKKA